MKPPDPEEPKRVAEAVSRLGLKYVVLTSVTRDDLADGGGSHFAATIKTIRSVASDILVEVLVPDFQGSAQSLATVVAAQPAVLNHNLETVPRLYPAVRPQADYQRSLRLLKEAKRLHPEATTKSGFMVGFGEKQEEVSSLLRDLRKANCDLVTIGQYLRPSRDHHPVVDYIHPELNFSRLIGKRLKSWASLVSLPVLMSEAPIKRRNYIGRLYRRNQDKPGLSESVKL
jgi:lipoic acid synthetase